MPDVKGEKSSQAALRRCLTLGMVGITPWLKRPDLALDLLDRLASRHDVQLVIRGALPSEYEWLLNRDEELVRYRGLSSRMSERLNLDGWCSSLTLMTWPASTAGLDGSSPSATMKAAIQPWRKAG
jgi:hypothetical protein